MSLAMVLEPDTNVVAHGRGDRDCALLESLRRHESAAAERLLTTYGLRAYRPGGEDHRKRTGRRGGRAGHVLGRGPEDRYLQG